MNRKPLEGKYYRQQIQVIFGLTYDQLSSILDTYSEDIETTLGKNVLDKRLIYTDETLEFLATLPGMRIKINPEDL
jgi:hypothetical protein